MLLKTRLSCFAICVALCAPVPGWSQTNSTIVNWGGNYVSSTVDLEGKNSASSGPTTGRNFSTSVAMNPTSGYGGTSGIFYGGAATTLLSGTNSPGFNLFEVQNQGPNDMLNFQITQGTDQHDVHYVQLWQKADFLSPGNTAHVSFISGSQYAVTITNANQSMNDAEGRWIARDGSTLYISQTTFIPQNGTFTYAPFVDGTSDGNWAVYSPSGLAIDFDQNTATFASHKFTDITGVGYYIEHDSFRDAYAWAVPGFSVVAAVPEPATLALAATSMLAGAGVYYRLRRKLRRQEQLPIG